jgi:3-isopropylmalate/(R)-2-methylmalate dehydratase small subunit
VLNPETNLGDKLFANWRYDASGNDQPEFVLNQPRYQSATILIAGANFGCGSSREAAVWALQKFGIRCLIAPSYGDIFYENCFQNGLLPIQLVPAAINKLVDSLAQSPKSSLEIDLRNCSIRGAGIDLCGFSLSADRKETLLLGVDTTALMRSWVDDICAFELRDAVERPWIYFIGQSHSKRSVRSKPT